MFFEREMLNPNNEKYLVKAIGYKLQYTIYDSITIKKITYAMYCKHGGLRRQRAENQAFISLH